MTLYHVPHIALGAEMSSDYDERSTLVNYRQFFNYIAVLFVYVVGFGFFFVSTPEFENGQLDASAYPPFALVLAIAASMAFATPLGYQTNLMVYGPGGYRFSDFLRLGIPLHLLAAGLTFVLAKTFWLS